MSRGRLPTKMVDMMLLLLMLMMRSYRWGSRVFLFKNDDNNTYTNTDKNKTPVVVVVLCAKRVCRKVSVCFVCFVTMMML